MLCESFGEITSTKLSRRHEEGDKGLRFHSSTPYPFFQRNVAALHAIVEPATVLPTPSRHFDLRRSHLKARPMFGQLPLELRQHIYTSHIGNCMEKLEKEIVPYHNGLTAFIPYKSAWLTVNCSISEEFGESLSRYTQSALVHFEFFDKAVKCERTASSAVFGTDVSLVH
jgi:hypothetical protein